MEFLVYLAGPIAGLSYEKTTDWRRFVAGSLPDSIVTLSPMRYKEALANERRIKDSYADQPLSSDPGLTTRDRFDVGRCDLVFVNFLGAEGVSVGSCIELGWADAWRKPIVVAMDVYNGNPHDHAMIRRLAGFILPTLDEAVDVARKVLLP